MKRTTTRHRREWKQFLVDNRRLFPFAGLFLLGVIAGVALFLAAPTETPIPLLSLGTVSGGLAGWLQALGGSCFATVLLLAALFLFGLWGCGAPFILSIPFLHGLGIGMTEAYYYCLGWSGVAAAAVLVVPVGLLTAAVLAMAGAESLRLSMSLSRHLLGNGADNPAHAFRLYCLRFLLFLLAALLVSLLDVVLRGSLSSLIPV